MGIKTVWMFSGQGSQFRGMGRTLYKTEATFRHWIERIDDLVKRDSGLSLIDQLYARSDAEPFDRLAATHPAIFAVEYALAKTLESKGLLPDLYFGASLGDYAVAALAGAYPLETIVTLLGENARLVEQRCTPGFMLAVFGHPTLYDALPPLRRDSDLVGVNFDEHFVIAGNLSDLAPIEQALAAAQVISYRLPVPVGFHSRNTAPLAAHWSAVLAGLAPARCAARPWFSCTPGAQLTTPAPDFFVRVALGPIRFREALQAVLAQHGHEQLLWVDLGPSGTMANFVAKNLAPDCQVFPLMTPYGNDGALMAHLLEAASTASGHARPVAMSAH